nr:DUF4140 domain-containing protein [Pedobacter sp.]
MKRIFLLNLLLISSLTLFSQENKIVTAEKIQGITVFRNLAEIKSTVNLNLNTGLNTVIIDNLPKSILKNSIQVSADAGIRIVQLTPITDYKRAALQTQAGLKITDSINKGIVKGHYAELYKLKDSMFVTKRAVAINLVEKDSVYIHGKKLMVTGKEGERIIRAFKNVRFYKIDMSG